MILPIYYAILCSRFAAPGYLQCTKSNNYKMPLLAIVQLRLIYATIYSMYTFCFFKFLAVEIYNGLNLVHQTL